MSWAEHPRVRIAVSLTAGVATLLSVAPFTNPGTRFIVAWNVFVIVLLTLIGVMMWRSSPQETRRRAQREEPSNVLVLLATLVTAAVGLGGIAYAQETTDGMSHLLRALHTGYSIVGVLLAWLLIHTVYSLHYAKMYYDETEDPGDGTFQKGLAFPGDRDVVDYWDFVYYAFTIAMCYQTSDVTITSPAMRRLTIFHATVSFMFVLLILGMLINIIGNVI